MRRGLVLAAESLTLLAVVLSPWPFGSATDAVRFALAATLSLAAACALASGEVGSPGRLGSLALLGLPLVCLLQIGLGTSAASAWTAEAFLVCGALLATFAVAASRRGPAAFRLAAALLAGALAQAAYGVYAWSVAPTRIYGVARHDVTMPFGSFVNHNHFAGFVEMPALLALGMALGHARRARALTPVSIGLGGVGLALTAAQLASRSRGGFVALGGGLLVLGLLAFSVLFRSQSKPVSRSSILARTALLLALVLGFAWLAAPPPARRHLLNVLSGRVDASGSYRLATAAATLRLAAAHPLVGSGYGAYEDAIPRYKTAHGEVRTTHAESDVLESLAEGGVLGLLATAALAAFVVGRFRARIRSRDPLRRGLAIGAFSGAAALLLHGVFDFNLRVPANALAFTVLLSLASLAHADAGPEEPPSRLPRVLAALLALLCLACAWRALGAHGFERALRRSDLNARIQALDEVIRLHPYLGEAWQARGAAWRELGNSSPGLRASRLARATSDFSEALRLRPCWAAVLAERGWTRGMLGDLESARRDLDNAVLLDPTHPGIRLLQVRFDRFRAEATPR